MHGYNPLIAHLFGKFSFFAHVNAAIADLVPLVCIAGWMFALRRTRQLCLRTTARFHKPMPMLSDDTAHKVKAQRRAASSVSLGHGHYDPMGEAFLQDRNIAQRGKERRIIFHAPGFPLAILRGEQGCELD
jgi:hypothetical protein